MIYFLCKVKDDIYKRFTINVHFYSVSILCRSSIWGQETAYIAIKTCRQSLTLMFFKAHFKDNQTSKTCFLCLHHLNTINQNDQSLKKRDLKPPPMICFFSFASYFSFHFPSIPCSCGRKNIFIVGFLHDDILRVRFSVIRDIVRAVLMAHVKFSPCSVFAVILIIFHEFIF